MEHVYALGVSCIESIQYWFVGWSSYFELVNHFANPHYVMEIMFPLISIVDSVFASQLLLCMAFGGWLNSVMKWWLLEDRPYWWVHETTYYTNSHHPHLWQTPQSCETGPGSPSGHSVTAASILILAVMWTSHVLNDRKWDVRWWKACVYPLFGAALGSVMLARMFVATHFPHQVLLGSLLGLFMAPALCIYVTDPYIWRYGTHSTMPVKEAVAWHAACAALAMAIAVLTYCSLRLCGVDPDFTVQLAYRWCAAPDSIHVSTTPLYALVQCTASLLGWALCVTPAVAEYRHYTKNRSLLISIFATGVSIYLLKRLDANITSASGVSFYVLKFILNAIKPALLLRVVPALAMWPYTGKKQKLQ
ncbi:glucose-6-phosphatase catalytic subunit 1 isoform X1 [Maniola hyperantus]|uniref:glucose-6-phosphatase catalytic subunit 1 isoform X1 n=2 Tax=Aphantopus hyperantus TaxID=2795564 RepID=UPI001568932C|nr:glucose-6-phosphatase isoform X1 [Maniola hyperantus]